MSRFKELWRASINATKKALTWNAEDLMSPSEKYIFCFNSKEELKSWHLYSDSEYGVNKRQTMRSERGSTSQQRKYNSYTARKPFYAPTAQLNTASYIIHFTSASPLTNDSNEFAPLRSEETGESESESESESNSPSHRWVEGIRPKLLARRIHNQDYQIAQLKEESLMMKERVMYVERELDDLKHRLKLLEFTQNAMGLTCDLSCDASFA